MFDLFLVSLSVLSNIIFLTKYKFIVNNENKQKKNKHFSSNLSLQFELYQFNYQVDTCLPRVLYFSPPGGALVAPTSPLACPMHLFH